MGTFEIYKPKQGKRTRAGTFAGGMLLALIGAEWLSRELVGAGVYIQYFVPTVVVLVVGYLIFWVVYQRPKADFLIATEGEMKKVAWSSRREVIGSTKVVVFATFILAALLFVVDMVFQSFFRFIRVLEIGAAS